MNHIWALGRIMDYFGAAIAIAVFTLVTSLWLNGPAVSAEQGRSNPAPIFVQY